MTQKKDRKKKNYRPIMAAIMVQSGSFVLVIVFLSLGTRLSFNYPEIMTPAWFTLWLLIGLGLGLGGFRISAGTWSGSREVLHWAAAIAGLLFLVTTLRLALFSTGSANVNRVGLWLSILVSVLALASRLNLTRTKKRAHEHRPGTADPHHAPELHASDRNVDFDESIVAELTRGDYFERARIRAKRRKSPWNLLLIPAVLVPYGFLAWFSFRTGNLLHMRIYPDQNLWKSQGVGIILVAVSPLIGALAPAMILGNFLVWLVPPARRALAEEAKPLPSTGYRNAQKQLFKAALVLVPVSVLLSALGVLLPWHK